MVVAAIIDVSLSLFSSFLLCYFYLCAGVVIHSYVVVGHHQRDCPKRLASFSPQSHTTAVIKNDRDWRGVAYCKEGRGGGT